MPSKLKASRPKDAKKGLRRLRLTKVERSELIKRRLFEAAIHVVGRFGYANAKVSQITSLAGVAQGTFYNHFGNRQELLEQLLPTAGKQMLDFISHKVRGESSARGKENARFQAFFDYLMHTPEFMRILNEAQIFAPIGYKKHMDNIAANYVRALKKDNVGGGRFTDEELEVVIHIMMGARSYLSQHYCVAGDGTLQPVSSVVVKAYEKLFHHGLFGG